MHKQIKLYRAPTGWIAHFLADGQADREVATLMGTHAIPTAFTAHAQAENVLAEIKRRNPDHDVVIG